MKRESGLTLIEVLIATGLFVIFAVSIFFTYGNILDVMNRTRTRTLGTTLLNREIEAVRQLPYDQVGIVSGSPSGILLSQKVVVYETVHFLVKTYVKNMDDPFDGTATGTPQDTAPADYKLVHLSVECPACSNFVPAELTTWVSPQNLETTTNNGSLFIYVFDANGDPVEGADVTIVNEAEDIDIEDVTNVDGIYALVDTPTSTNGYEVTVSKTGYSSGQTYPLDDASNPNPVQAHATVASQMVTELGFGIDKTSTVTAYSRDHLCSGIGSIGFNVNGEKLIGTDPDVYKYSSSFTTDSTGKKTLSALEWDSYHFVNTNSSYDLAGSIPYLPLIVDPDTSSSVSLVLEPHTTTSLLVSIEDDLGEALDGATVNIQKGSYSKTLVAGERFWTDTDWAAYSAQDGNIDTSTNGTIKLQRVSGNYPTSTNSWLTSNTFDFGTTSTTLHNVVWSPTSQPNNTTLKFQLASNNDNSTWTYVGPDGTGSTYYTSTGSIGTMHDGNRYVRYKAYLNTTSQSATPSLDEVTIGFSSGCVPQSQTFFSNLSTGTYAVTVSKTGYTTASDTVDVATGWQEFLFTLE